MTTWWSPPANKARPAVLPGCVLDPPVYTLPPPKPRIPSQNPWDSPPPDPASVGTARYCTTRSLYRGPDEERKRALSLEQTSEPRPDNKELLSPVVSDLVIDSTCPLSTRELPANTHSYIDTYKAMLRMKGLELDEMFSGERYRPKEGDQSPRSDPGRGVNRRPMDRRPKGKRRRPRRNKKPEIKLPDINGKNGTRSNMSSSLGVSPHEKPLPGNQFHPDPSKDEATMISNRSGETVTEAGRALLDSPERVGELVDLYRETPGFQQRRRQIGRKLGNTVSSQRLHQLLEGQTPLKMHHFYNYYP